MSDFNYYFSPSNFSFYANALKETYYAPADSWPNDAFEVSDEVTNEFKAQPPNGEKLGIIDGLPGWIDILPPTHDEQVAAADTEKQKRVDQANKFMNSKQWPGKAAMGLLKDLEKTQYNA